MANPQARAAYADMARGAAGAAPNPATALTPDAPGYSAGRTVGQGLRTAQDWAIGSRPQATSVLGKAKNFGAGAATAAGRAAGLLSVGNTLRENFDAMSNLARDENTGLDDLAAGGVEFIGNTVAGGVSALSRKFPMIGPAVSAVVGADGASRAIDAMSPGASVLRRYGLGSGSLNPGLGALSAPAAQPSAPPATTPPRPDLHDPYQVRPADSPAGPPASAARPTATQPTAAQPTAAQPTATQPATVAPGAVTNDVTRNGNEYSGMNVGGNITVNGMAPRGGAISAQDMAAANALDAQQRQDSLARIAAEAGGQSAPQLRYNPNSGADYHWMNDLRDPRYLAVRNASVSPSIFSERRANAVRKAIADQMALTQGADADRYRADQTLRGQTFSAQTGADASRYASDNALRGDIYKADATGRAARYAALVAAQNRAYDDVIRQNDLDIKNTDRTRSRFAVYGDDGKVDEAGTTRALAAIDKIMPGFSRMSENDRGKAFPQADALFSIYNRAAQGRELGLGQMVFGNTNPQLDTMPNFKGGTLKRQGLSGALPGQAGLNGYFVEMPDGREVELGQNLSQNELDLIRRNINTGKWTD